ncbi:MAG: hypothetical protein PHD25_08540 [Bacteroidales bacterium]|nr:hypothetical protein [Bacteroidales bacterium]
MRRTWSNINGFFKVVTSGCLMAAVLLLPATGMPQDQDRTGDYDVIFGEDFINAGRYLSENA